jgi:predicted AAA+ superfamily ATPase
MNEAKLLEILEAYNRFWRDGTIASGIRRDVLSTCMRVINTKEVVAIKGPRRSGKSTLMAQVISSLLAEGIPPKSILRINLEEPLLAPEYGVELLEQIYRLFRERVCPEGKVWIFLDEIQNIPKWEIWVRGRSESEDVKMFVTGSSARMLSREIGTRLTGRHLPVEVSPLSFKEFLVFKDCPISSELEYTGRKALVRNLFLEYLLYGGFPEVVLRDGTEEKEMLLKQYFEDILYRDIAARYEIRDTSNLRNLAVYLLTNISRPTSINKLKGNFSISQDKTENYVSAILEGCLLFKLQKFSFSLKSMQRAGFKPYAADTGLRNRVAFSFSKDRGQIAENVVFNYLRIRNEELYYAGNGAETDFVVKEGLKIKSRIQVWYDDAGVTAIPEREIYCFSHNPGKPGSIENILLTNDYEDQLDVNGLRVRCIPTVKFLLQLEE